ncbi:hypothetical protein KC19_VG230600 [Ceratodon purpureus]|uniref:adenylate kinase n=1 Tax=Ceratodon purpureus TaxID=3225 RepID=A0A8T0HTC6_CERPU|nr:hypothetical protein KC19_VG230600 [Ceratodon purpureus]
MVDAGGPGTGKGTQCGRMVKEFGFKHISLGEILRKEVKNRSQIGEEYASIMKEGKLVPLDMTLRLMKNAIEQSNDASGYILDGFPRAVNQAKGFTKQVKAPSLVLYLHAPHEVLKHRLMQRGQISGRADDNAETIRKRLATFKKQSLPVVTYYEKTNTTVKRVCTITTTDDIYNQVREAVRHAIFSPERLRRHVRRRKISSQRESARGKRRRGKSKKISMEDCPGHPEGSPVGPVPTQECIVM